MEPRGRRRTLRTAGLWGAVAVLIVGVLWFRGLDEPWT